MNRLALAAFAAVIAFACPAFAAECITVDIVQDQLIKGTHNPEYVISQAKLDNPAAIHDFLDTLAAVAGHPPNEDTITLVVIYRPSDLEKFGTYVGLFDIKGCRVAGAAFPSAIIEAVIKKSAGVGPGILPDGQRDS